MMSNLMTPKLIEEKPFVFFDKRAWIKGEDFIMMSD